MVQLPCNLVLRWCLLASLVTGLIVTGRSAVPATSVSVGVDGCPSSFQVYSVKTTVVCVQEGFTPFEVPGAVGVHALFFGDFHLAAEGFLPNGTRDLRVRPIRSKPLDPPPLSEPGPFDGTHLRRSGPFNNIYADELTMRGYPIAIECKKGLYPWQAGTPAQQCQIRGRLSNELGFRLTVLTFSWLDKPAWPIFDAQYAKTWPSLLADLDSLLAQFIIVPE